MNLIALDISCCTIFLELNDTYEIGSMSKNLVHTNEASCDQTHKGI
jgi:hypothetical protein